MTHIPGHGGVVRRRDLFDYQNDPDYPSASAVKSAGVIDVPPIVKNSYSDLTGPLPSIPASPEAEAFVRKSDNFYFGQTPPKLPQTPPNTTRGTATGGLAGMTAEEALALAKFNYEKEKDANKLAGLQALQNNFGSGFDELLNMIAEQGKVSEKQTQNVYDTAIKNIGQGYDAARDLGTSGYAALNQYLRENPNNPYAGMVAQTGTPADAMSNFLQAYGVSDLPVQAQVQADILQSGQGAANFQNLINTLGAIAQQSDVSRGAESQMAQLAFDTGLGQDRAGYQTQAENAKMQALAALQKAMFESQFSVAQQRNAQRMALAQAVAELGGNTGNGGSGSGSGSGSGENDNMPPAGPLPGQLLQTATPQEIVANQLANLLAPAQAQNSTAEQLLAELNARRGR